MVHLIHLTDLFHPHGDPDDHFDLATVFALHKLGKISLDRVIIDYPPAHRKGDPALCAVAQLNAITGSDVPASVAPKSKEGAAEMLLRCLREAVTPVTFTVVGSATAIASALTAEPALFAEKCAAIYLSGGTGVETPGGELEYNARQDPAAYAAMFSAPCPLYWLPCYHTIEPGLHEKGGEFGSCWCIQQKEILEVCSPAMRNYFLYMLTQSDDPKYLRYLDNPVDFQALAEYGEGKRRLWSTAALLHLAGIECESYDYLPIDVSCSDDGHPEWAPDINDRSGKYLFKMRKNDRPSDDTFAMGGSYHDEMLEKLRALLGAL